MTLRLAPAVHNLTATHPRAASWRHPKRALPPKRDSLTQLVKRAGPAPSLWVRASGTHTQTHRTRPRRHSHAEMGQHIQPEQRVDGENLVEVHPEQEPKQVHGLGRRRCYDGSTTGQHACEGHCPGTRCSCSSPWRVFHRLPAGRWRVPDAALDHVVPTERVVIRRCHAE